MAILKVQHLFKHYNGAKYISARDINFEVKEGEIFGFLGVNGAGKSTSIKCITGIIPFTSGKIEICGFDNKKDPYNAKKCFGFVPDNHAVYDKLTGSEYVNYIADLYGVEENVRKERFEMLCAKFKIGHAVNNQIMSYSHGMKQKISIIGALIHMPKLWILDEPMVGLDPQSIFEVKEYMKEYAKKGNSVFFSSHNLDTVQVMCDRAVIVHGGIVIADIDLHEYRRTGKDLEKEFMELTRQAGELQNQMRKEINDEEAELAKKVGKHRASRATVKKIDKMVHDLIEKTKDAPCVNTFAIDLAKSKGTVQVKAEYTSK
ncbi:MAG: ABC transporter ATP-binding protein [Christensenellaceae bacterium]|jgi:ABC-2 type transport system ATP-binding protein|nr:ABC transporter ATP-binding protein [Christensenellaceae bacterium]